jgi:glycogen operon protein
VGAIFIVLNSAVDAIKFHLPKIAEYKAWHQLFDTTSDSDRVAPLPSGSETTAPPRSVLAFSGTAE